MAAYTKKKEQIVFIGAGNVATSLSQAFKEVGYRIRQVYSRSLDSAKSLGNLLRCKYTTDINEVVTDADLYFFTVPDSAFPTILSAMPPNNGLWIHTAGSLPMDIFRGYTARYGVLYPLQTFSTQRQIDLSEVPIFIEANTQKDEDFLFDVAEWLSFTHVTVMDSVKRKHLHLAAVFACNFSNYMYSIAAQLLEKQGLEWELLLPLINETVEKLYDLSPEQAQTGPAVRGDQAIIEQHLSMLEDERLRNIYKLLSDSIVGAKNLSPA